jgi:hypothetical protein
MSAHAPTKSFRDRGRAARLEKSARDQNCLKVYFQLEYEGEECLQFSKASQH